MSVVESAVRAIIYSNPWAFQKFLDDHLRETKTIGYCLACEKKLKGNRIYFCDTSCSNDFLEKHMGELVEIITQ